MKGNLKKLLGVVLSAGIMFSSVGSLPTYAADENSTYKKASAIEANKEYEVSFEKDEKGSKWYKLELAKDGYVTIDSEGVNPYYDRLTLYDSDLNSFYSEYMGDAYSSNKYGVAAGTYYAEIKAEYGAKSDNKFTYAINYKEDDSWEKEDNATPVNATVIPLNKTIKGNLYKDADVDYYKFTLEKNGTVSVDFFHDYIDSGNHYWGLQLLDVNNRAYLDYWYVGNMLKEDNSRVNGLSAGDYYIKIYKNDHYSSKNYEFKINYTANADWEAEPNGATTSADKLEMGKSISGCLYVEDDVDYYEFTVEKRGIVNIAIETEFIDSGSQYWWIYCYDKAGNTKLGHRYGGWFGTDKYDEAYGIAGNRSGKSNLGTLDTIDGKCGIGFLEPGTYYLKIQKGESFSRNKYTLTMNSAEELWAPKTDMGWFERGNWSFWYENGVRQGTYDDPQGVLGDGTVRGREICDNSILDANGNGTWFWLDSVYDGAKAVGKEVWMPYIYQDEANWDDATKANIAAESDYGMDGMGRCVLDAINNKAGKWVRYDNEGKMLKGWVEIKGDLAEAYPDQVGNKYYYDTRTGLMAKGWVKIDGVDYYFDETSGVLQ
ncbi:MAG: pre-peptidase C-terminal domain-containing protein [Lachnospiraceae bacterium]|nr:pre-peptidase C-terminal domain-containing protein [Lachnospiraceae bacterium]